MSNKLNNKKLYNTKFSEYRNTLQHRNIIHRVI